MFSCEFCNNKKIKAPSLKNTSGRLLLKNFVFNSLMLLIDYLIHWMFIHNKCIISGSRTVAPEKNCPPTLNLILILTLTLTLTGEQLSWHHHFRFIISYFLRFVKSIFSVALFPGISPLDFDSVFFCHMAKWDLHKFLELCIN